MIIAGANSTIPKKNTSYNCRFDNEFQIYKILSFLPLTRRYFLCFLHSSVRHAKQHVSKMLIT